jgi:hypothetical protein
MTTSQAEILAALATATYRKSSYTAANGECVMVGHAATYRTSSYTAGNGACVMIAHTDHWVGIQDSKQTTRDTIAATPAQFDGFLTAIRDGHLHQP